MLLVHVYRACSPGSVARHCKLVHVKADLALEPGAACTCSNRTCSPGSIARHCKFVHVHVKSDLALEPGAACTCLHKTDSPGSAARPCKLVHAKSDLALEPGAACTCYLCLVARLCKLVPVKSDLASEPGAASTCSHRACSSGSVARLACLYVLGQTWLTRCCQYMFTQSLQSWLRSQELHACLC